jgi:hypothetical protein
MRRREITIRLVKVYMHAYATFAKFQSLHSEIESLKEDIKDHEITIAALKGASEKQMKRLASPDSVSEVSLVVSYKGSKNYWTLYSASNLVCHFFIVTALTKICSLYLFLLLHWPHM